MGSRLPIRWRLTAWYALFLAVALLAFGGAIYAGLRVRLYNSFDDQLRNEAALLKPAITDAGGTLAMAANPAAIPNDGEHLIRLLNADGRPVVDTSPAMGGVPLSRQVFAAALAGRTHLTTVPLEDGPLRILTVPVPVHDQVVGVLQVGLFRTDVNETLSTLLLLLGIAAPVALLVAAGGGYLLARRALAPVAAITQVAARIGGNDLHARLNLPLPNDELGQLAHTFDAMLARIEDAFERQRRFTGDAAHELRTPLSLMRSQVDLALARPRPPAEYREALRGLESDLERLTGMVGALLTLARADTDRLTIERTPFDLAETVALVLEQYAPAADEAGVALKGETFPCPIHGDEDRLVQVLVNLLDNALAHTPAGGTIAVGCQRERSAVKFWVTDTGAGIAPEHQQRVFDRFYRVDPGRARVAGGAGLGLSITRAIVEAHGGTIALTGAVGRGTRVDMLLPDGE